MEVCRFNRRLLCFLLLQVLSFQSTTAEKCRGAFDVYFVLDRSSSLLNGPTNHFRSDTVPFVEKLSNMFVSPLLRMSYITFSGDAETVMPLTGDRSEIQKKLLELKNKLPSGPTNMHLGFLKATQQITQTKDRRASIIIALTDGILDRSTKAKTVEQANRARSFGSAVFMVGISDYNERQLVEIAGGKSEFVFQATDFKKLSAIANKILDGSCVEILSANPSIVCVNDTFDVRIHGRGFKRNGDISLTMCNFWADGHGILKKPKEATDTFLLCESPEEFFFNDDKVIVVQVSLNKGISFISSNVTISAYKCTFKGTYIWISLIFLVLLGLIAIWWMWNVITCKKSLRKPSPSRPPPPPPATTPVSKEPKHHWPAVDASYYGGAGAGGIKPVQVRWGDKGCTEAASHLEKTKDAKEIVSNVKLEEIEYASIDEPTKSTLLCASFLAPLVKVYAWLEKKRPRNN